MANRVELVYGRSGAGKSTWVLQLAEAIWKKHKKKTRLYIGDGGLETYEATGLVEDGIIEVMIYNLRDHPLETAQFIAEGYWSLDPADPTSKLMPPNYAALAETHGLFIYEGLSVMADYLMGSKIGGLSEQSARLGPKGIGGGIDTPYVVTDGSLKFGGVSMSGYGFIQRRMLDLVERTRALPGWVYWTAHERAIDADANDDRPEPLVGPDVAGKALTGTIGRSFGNTIHMHLASRKLPETVDKTTGQKVSGIVVEHRAYTRPHFDPDGKTFIKFYANNRMPLTQRESMPEYLCPANPLEFYRILEEGKRNHRELRERAEKEAFATA